MVVFQGRPDQAQPLDATAVDLQVIFSGVEARRKKLKKKGGEL